LPVAGLLHFKIKKFLAELGKN